MHCKILWYGSAILMLFMLSIAYVKGDDSADDTEATTNANTLCAGDDCQTFDSVEAGTTVARTVAPSTMAQTTAKAAVKTTQSRKSSKRNNKKTLYKLVHAGRLNTGFQSMNIWLAYREVSKKNDTKDSNEKDGDSEEKSSESESESEDETSESEHDSEESESKKKIKKKPVRFLSTRIPVRYYAHYNQLLIQRFPKLVAISPWLPIYYDKTTHETIIFSRKGGYYILPPLMNFYSQRFSVAQLIKWGKASLVSSGAPPQPNVDVAQLIQSQSPDFTSQAFDENRARFTTNMRANFVYIQPRPTGTIYQ